jgi:hypothetical protein
MIDWPEFDFCRERDASIQYWVRSICLSMASEPAAIQLFFFAPFRMFIVLPTWVMYT